MVAYEFYTNTYRGGSISPADWPTYERVAAAQLAKYKRIYTVTIPEDSFDTESMAICSMAEALYSFDLIANGEGGVQSASIGSVSASYGSSGTAVDISLKGRAKELYSCACLYLDIYRGVR